MPDQEELKPYIVPEFMQLKKKLVNIDELPAALMVGLKKATLETLARNRTIPSIKLGNARWFNVDTVMERLLELAAAGQEIDTTRPGEPKLSDVEPEGDK